MIRKNKKSYPRFVFTQISGVVAGLLGAFVAVKMLYIKMQSTFEGTDGTFPFVAVLFLAVILVGSMIGAMKIWGWLLVKIGLLSKEEAKGYPYSKPWEVEDDKYL